MLAKTDTAIRSMGLRGYDGCDVDFASPRCWTMLTARPSKEQDAADWLKNSRLFAYWPCFTKQVLSQRSPVNGRSQRRVRFLPVIPGYIFMAASVNTYADPFDIVRQTPGIIGYVRDGSGRPAILSDYDVDVVRKIEALLNLPYNPKTSHKFKVGDKVRFCGDLLGRWLPGVIDRLESDGRIVVGTPLLGRIVPITVFPHQIEAM